MAKKLNEAQWRAIAILSQPKKSGMSYEEIAKEVGVARSTLFEWKKREDFNQALKDEIVRNTLEHLPEIFDSIPKHIIEDGNAALFRTMLQAHGMLTERHEVKTQENSADTDAIRAEIEQFKQRKQSD